MVNPFQFTFDIVDNVSQQAQEMTSSIERLADANERINERFDQLRNLAITGLGLIGITTGFEALMEAATETDNVFAQLQTTLGGKKEAEGMLHWVNEMSTQLPVQRDQLIELSKTYTKLGGDIRSIDIASLSSASLALGKDVTEIEERFRDLAKQQRLTTDDFVELRKEYGVTADEWREMNKVMKENSKDTIGKINGLLGTLGEKYASNLDRSNQSIGTLKQTLGSYMTMFKEAMLGNPDTGIIGAVRKGLISLVQFFDKNKKTIIEIAQGVGQVIASVFGFIVDLGKIIGKRLQAVFDKMTAQSGGFQKNVVLPFITFMEIVKVKLEAFIDGFISGFAESPVWDIIGSVFKLLYKGIMLVLEALGLVDTKNGDSLDNWKSLGYWVGQAAAIYVAYLGYLKAMTVYQMVAERVTNLINGYQRLSAAVVQGNAVWKRTGSVTKGMTSIMRALNLTILANPYVAIAAAIVGATVLIYTYWDELVARFPMIGKGADDIKARFSAMFERLQPALQKLGDSFGAVFQKIFEVWQKVEPIVMPIVEFLINKAIADIIIVLDVFLAAFQFTFDQIAAVIDLIVNIFNGFVKVFKGIFNGDIDMIMEGFKEIFNAPIQYVKDMFTAFSSFLGGIMDAIGNYLSNAFSIELPGWLQEVIDWLKGDSVDGSHADGLAYVPKDNYIAKLHKGERVLTAEENEEYTRAVSDNKPLGNPAEDLKKSMSSFNPTMVVKQQTDAINPDREAPKEIVVKAELSIDGKRLDSHMKNVSYKQSLR